jgi:hypothetical protein
LAVTAKESEGHDPVHPAELGAYVAAEVAKWGRVVRAANIKPE